MRIVVGLCVPTKRVAEYKSDKNEVKESERVKCKVREKCESQHLQKRFLRWFCCLAE